MHRILYQEAYGEIEAGIVIWHSCDNRKCINIDHLLTGSMQENNNDRIKRGRDNPPYGERSGTAKLKNQDVIFIRNSVLTDKELSEKFNVGAYQINRIRHYKRWKHIT